MSTVFVKEKQRIVILVELQQNVDIINSNN